jgi:hypothetical protein
MKNLFLFLITILSFNTVFAQQITGATGKIWYHEKTLYVNVLDKGVLVIDNENPKEPKKLGFIEIPGNVDIAVIDEVLFANNFDDLIAIDISKLDKISNKKILRRFDGVFPQHGTGSDKIDWTEPSKKSWMSSGTSMASGNNSIGGLMACLTVIGKSLYAINGEEIHSFDVSNPKTPELIGMYKHTESCDPVVVEGNRAYVTLRGGTECNHQVNRLEIVDISNPQNPKRISSTKMTNLHGLAVDCGYVYLCDVDAGFKVVDATNPQNPRLK